MKRVAAFVWILVSVICGGPAAGAASVFQGDLFAPAKNDYVLYYDHRAGAEQIFGVQYLGGTDYLVRTYDLQSKDELIVRCTINETPTTYSLGDYSFQKGTMSTEALKKTLVPLMLIRSQADKVDTSQFPADARLSVSVGEGADKSDQTFTYKFWVPVFRLYSIQVHGDGSSMVLFDFGKPGDTDNGRFLGTFGPPEVRQGPHYTLAPKDPLKLQAGGVSLELDKNWKITKDSGLVISNATPRDAFISLESVSFDPAKIDFADFATAFGYIKMMQLGLPISADSVMTQSTDTAGLFGFDVLNEADRMYSHVTEVLINNGNGGVAIVYVNTYSSLYETNRDYFDGIARRLVEQASGPH